MLRSATCISVVVLAISLQHGDCFVPTLATSQQSLASQQARCIGPQNPVSLRMASNDKMPRFLGSRRLGQISQIMSNPEVIDDESKVVGSRRLSAAISLLTNGVDAESNSELIAEVAKLKQKEETLDQELAKLENEVGRLEQSMEEIKKKAEQKEKQTASKAVETAKVPEPKTAPAQLAPVAKDDVPASVILAKAKKELEEAERKAREDVEKARLEQEALSEIGKSYLEQLDAIRIKSTKTLDRGGKE